VRVSKQLMLILVLNSVREFSEDFSLKHKERIGFFDESTETYKLVGVDKLPKR